MRVELTVYRNTELRSVPRGESFRCLESHPLANNDASTLTRRAPLSDDDILPPAAIMQINKYLEQWRLNKYKMTGSLNTFE